MKNSSVCPKCNSTDILRIPGSTGAYGSGDNILMGYSVFSAINVTRYLCCNCGYSEEWIDEKSDIEKLRRKYR